MFQSLMREPTVLNGNRILILGPTKGWIERLRKEGFGAFGASDREMWQLYYAETRDYGNLPWRTAAFKIIVVLVDLNRSVLLEMDRLLIPEGFVLVKLPVAYSHFSYELFLEYLNFHRHVRSFPDMAIWRKHNGWDYLAESA